MKIIINEDSSVAEVTVTIDCKAVDEQVAKLIRALNAAQTKLVGMKENQTYFLKPENILYIESVDKRTFIYTKNEVFESPLRLYEFEEQLGGGGFFRTAKSTVVNLSAVSSMRPDFGGRLILTMQNQEKIYVSRQYAAFIKQKLGI